MIRGLAFIVSFLLLASISSGQETDSSKYKVLPPEEFIKEFHDNADAVLIDVRNSKDYRKSRINEAINIPASEITDDYFGGPEAIPVDKSIFIYCYVGYSSKRAAVKFYDHGYRNIYSLEGGFNKWKGKKLKVDKKKHRS